METFEGTLESEGGGPVAYLDLLVRTQQEETRVRFQGALTLVTRDGRRLTIEGLDGAEVEAHTAWHGAPSDIPHLVAEHVLTKANRAATHLWLEGSVLRNGDRVTLEGVAVEGAFRDTLSLRSAPEREATRIRAVRVRAGLPVRFPTRSAGWEAWPYARGTRALAAGAAVLGSFAVAAGKVLAVESELRRALLPALVVALAALVIAGSRWLRLRFHAPQVAGFDDDRPRRITLGMGADAMLLFGVAFFATFGAVMPTPSVSSVLGVLVAGIPLVHAAAVAFGELEFRRFARSLLRRGRPALAVAPALLTRTARFRWATIGAGENEHSELVCRVSTQVRAFELEVGGEQVEVTPHGSPAIAFPERVWRSGSAEPTYDERLERDVFIELEGTRTRAIWCGTRGALLRSLHRSRWLAVGLIALASVPVLVSRSWMPFGMPHEVSGRVVESTHAGVPVGSECVARVLAYPGYDHLRCSVRMTCADEALYGAFGLGALDCDVRGGRPWGVDALSTDGDPGLELGDDVEWWDDQRRVRVAVTATRETLIW